MTKASLPVIHCLKRTSSTNFANSYRVSPPERKRSSDSVLGLEEMESVPWRRSEGSSGSAERGFAKSRRRLWSDCAIPIVIKRSENILSDWLRETVKGAFSEKGKNAPFYFYGFILPSGWLPPDNSQPLLYRIL